MASITCAAATAVTAAAPTRRGAGHSSKSARATYRGAALRAAAPARLASSTARGRQSLAVKAMMPGMGPGGMNPGQMQDMLKNMDPEKLKEMQAQYEQAMKDPETRKKVEAQMAQMQGMMANPAMQKQMQAMNNMVANPDMQQRIAALKDDPDFEDFFADVQKNGPGAMMKYSTDREFLKKLNDKLGGEEAIRAAVGGAMTDADMATGPGGAAPAAAAAPPAPEIETVHDAARYGDLEAVEDFIAIGKDINARDTSSRTPIHYAIAFGKGEVGEEIFQLLVEGGADLNAVDEKKNTPLHYACGYGKIFAVKALLEKGADTALANGTGKTPLDLVKLEAKNPINEEAELLAKLGA